MIDDTEAQLSSECELCMEPDSVRGTLTVSFEAWRKLGHPGRGVMFFLDGSRYITAGIQRSRTQRNRYVMEVRRLSPA